MGGRSEIMAGCGWSWVVRVDLWLVMRGGCEIMAGQGWWWENYGWLCPFDNQIQYSFLNVIFFSEDIHTSFRRLLVAVLRDILLVSR